MKLNKTVLVYALAPIVILLTIGFGALGIALGIGSALKLSIVGPIIESQDIRLYFFLALAILGGLMYGNQFGDRVKILSQLDLPFDRSWVKNLINVQMQMGLGSMVMLILCTLLGFVIYLDMRRVAIGMFVFGSCFVICTLTMLLVVVGKLLFYRFRGPGL